MNAYEAISITYQKPSSQHCEKSQSSMNLGVHTKITNKIGKVCKFSVGCLYAVFIDCAENKIIEKSIKK